MKTIALRGGKLAVGTFAIVDDDIYDAASLYIWRIVPGKKTFYAYRKWMSNGKIMYQSLHHFVLGIKVGTIGKLEIDHKNRNGLDCRKENLRTATGTQNQANGPRRGGSSRFKGVAWHKSQEKWRAYIQCAGKWKHLGYFISEEDAARAYDRAAQEAFGEFATPNLAHETG